jgi:hypothetical protein
MRRGAPITGFSWPRVFGIAAALGLHAGIGLWVSLPSDSAPAEGQGTDPFVWEIAPHVPVALPPLPRPSSSPATNLPPSPLDVYTQRSDAEPPRSYSRIAPPQISSEWHADPAYVANPSNPLDRPAVLEHTPTRFDDAWISDGTVVDQLAHRYRAVALIRAATGYQKPCTESEKRQQLPRCFPKPADPRG